MSKIAADLKELMPRLEPPAGDDRSVEFLWVYDPQEDKVHLEDGEEDHENHPADFPTHEEMAEHVTHPERQQGYAYSIGNKGDWRICNEHFKKIEDVHIRKLLLTALHHEDPPAPLPNIRYHGDPR